MSLVVAALTVGSCATAPVDSPLPLPHFEVEGTLGRSYDGLDDLAEASSAIIVAEPLGEQSFKDIPALPGAEGKPAPVEFARLKMARVVAGTLGSQEIDVVTPGADTRTGLNALLQGGTPKDHALGIRAHQARAIGACGEPRFAAGLGETRNSAQAR
ncbi:MAG: hypothetical protein LBT54_07115 [Bifidobacteriaceae bacterium]|nr:hypothetical protein [Bifidobacteriaceae bacterium]